MAKKGWLGTHNIGTDSFVDVLSNTVGALVLLCILAALEVGWIRWPFFAAQSQEADTKPIIMVVSGDRVRLADFAPVFAAIRSGGGHMRLPAQPSLNYDATIEQGYGERGTTAILSASTAYPGDTIPTFLANQGTIAGQLGAYDPSRYHFFLYLTNDGFDHYLILRQFLKSRRYQVGWGTIESERELGFTIGGGGGGAGGVEEGPFTIQR